MEGIDRKAIPRNLAESYRRSRGDYADALGRPVRSKPLLHRDAAIEALPSPLDVSLTRPVPPAGSGVLELVVDAAATMPVAAVDEVPVAVGDGTVFVVLPAGPHAVDVQSGAATSPVVVAVEDGATAVLVWREEADRRTVRFGPEAVDALPPASRVYLYEWAVLTVLVCGLPFGAVNAFAFDGTASRVVLVVLAVVILGLVPFAPWRRRERARLAALRLERQAAALSRPVRYPWDGPEVPDRPALVGDRPESLPELAPGYGALLLRATAHRHLWKDGDGVTVRDTALAALRAEPPRVRLDGLEVPATWGNWWHPLRPGAHVLEFEAAGAAARLELVVADGEATAVRAEAHLYAHRDGGEIVREDARLRLEPEEFRPEWMGDPAKRLAYWN
ncbi:hypothetical protein [Glycomyces terrestris]|uniref:Uncharacterized protein n=1 Tax=Glycomyces terrestris TaxID=2493553 RepID=A0A426V5T8_9ACTN|nr:hypothetical protein [Glycomyces terrestris]RRS02170.1 hypothetical protein EIW28_05440 [Glycomyces terrestris]